MEVHGCALFFVCKFLFSVDVFFMVHGWSVLTCLSAEQGLSGTLRVPGTLFSHEKTAGYLDNSNKQIKTVVGVRWQEYVEGGGEVREDTLTLKHVHLYMFLHRTWLKNYSGSFHKRPSLQGNAL